jgi:hypothetical protein
MNLDTDTESESPIARFSIWSFLGKAVFGFLVFLLWLFVVGFLALMWWSSNPFAGLSGRSVFGWICGSLDVAIILFTVSSLLPRDSRLRARLVKSGEGRIKLVLLAVCLTFLFLVLLGAVRGIIARFA